MGWRRCGVAADSGFTRAHVEHAKASQFNAIALEATSSCFQRRFNGEFGFGLGNAGFVHDFVDDVEFDRPALAPVLRKYHQVLDAKGDMEIVNGGSVS
jgi:hypothetical protein